MHAVPLLQSSVRGRNRCDGGVGTLAGAFDELSDRHICVSALRTVSRLPAHLLHLTLVTPLCEPCVGWVAVGECEQANVVPACVMICCLH